MTAPQIHRPPRAVHNAEHDADHPGDRETLDDAEVPPIIRTHYLGLGADVEEARQ